MLALALLLAFIAAPATTAALAALMRRHGLLVVLAIEVVGVAVYLRLSPCRDCYDDGPYLVFWEWVIFQPMLVLGGYLSGVVMREAAGYWRIRRARRGSGAATS